MKLISVTTGKCMFCGKHGIVENVPADGFNLWQDGLFIQEALYMLSADDREQLMTGTHGACFDAMCPDEDEEGEDPNDAPF